VEVHILDDYFDPTTPDDRWLTYAGQRGWIVITKDYNIRRHRVALNALIRNRVKAFVLADPHQIAEEMAQTIVRALPRIRRLVSNHPPPFIARIARSGAVSLIPLRQR
jgi:PIN like domain